MDDKVFDKILKSKFADSIFDAINRSSIDLVLKKVKINQYKEEYLFYPSGAKELDDGLVNDVLDWLEDFPKAQEKLISALEKYMSKGDGRNILDDLRLCLELFVKQLLGNEKSLEKNKELLGKYIGDKGVSDHITKTYVTLIGLFTCYQNESVKHNEKYITQEIEYILYLTGSFIRFIMTIDEEDK